MSINEGYNLLVDKLESWIELAIAMLPNLVAAILVLVAFFIIGKFVRRFTNKMLHKVTNNKTIVDLLETIVGVAVVGIGLFIALGILNLSGAVTSLLAGAGIVGLALGFAFQDIAANFISGILLTIRHPFGKGDIIESNDYYGTVVKLNLRSTIVRVPQGQLVYIPNKEVYSNPFENFTATGERRVDISCGVSYGDDLNKAKEVALKAIESLDNYNKEKPVEFFYDEFGGSSINFKLRFWVKFEKNQDFLSAQSDAIVALTKHYDEADIMIPFPIRTLDFGIRGGEKLSPGMLQAANGNGSKNGSGDSNGE